MQINFRTEARPASKPHTYTHMPYTHAPHAGPIQIPHGPHTDPTRAPRRHSAPAEGTARRFITPQNAAAGQRRNRTKENRVADIYNAASVRSEADSNRCTRFCRPLPSHSAIRPFLSRNAPFSFSLQHLQDPLKPPGTFSSTSGTFSAPLAPSQAPSGYRSGSPRGGSGSFRFANIHTFPISAKLIRNFTHFPPPTHPSSPGNHYLYLPQKSPRDHDTRRHRPADDPRHRCEGRRTPARGVRRRPPHLRRLARRAGRRCTAASRAAAGHPPAQGLPRRRARAALLPPQRHPAHRLDRPRISAPAARYSGPAPRHLPAGRTSGAPDALPLGGRHAHGYALRRDDVPRPHRTARRAGRRALHRQRPGLRHRRRGTPSSTRRPGRTAASSWRATASSRR